MLKMRSFFEKKSPSSGAPPLDSHNLTHTNCTATKQNVLILSPIKSQFWLVKFGAILVPPLFVILPLHFSWSGDGIDRIHSRERKTFWICKILILPKAIQFNLTKSARGCGCIPSSYGTDRISNSDQ